MSCNPYRSFVATSARALQKGAALPLGGLTPRRAPRVRRGAPSLLLFAPHPDDECLTGGLALRLRRTARWRVANVAVTLGSRADRQLARWEELQGACTYLGFDLLSLAPRGLERINPKARSEDRPHWEACVNTVARLLADQRPRAIQIPHERDWNSTHIGTHWLVVDALRQLGPSFTCTVVESEYWQPMETPNLMVESNARDVADLIAATSFHAGEVARNPYHLRQPAWMQDNVRRGGELVGGQGGAAPAFAFATIYRVRTWQAGGFRELFSGGRMLAATDAPETALA